MGLQPALLDEAMGLVSGRLGSPHYRRPVSLRVGARLLSGRERLMLFASDIVAASVTVSVLRGSVESVVLWWWFGAHVAVIVAVSVALRAGIIKSDSSDLRLLGRSILLPAVIGSLPWLDPTIPSQDPGRFLLLVWVVGSCAILALFVIILTMPFSQLWVSIVMIGGSAMTAYLYRSQWSAAVLCFVYLFGFGAAVASYQRRLSDPAQRYRGRAHPYIDSLTRVLNRDTFFADLDSAQGSEGAWTLAVIDLDRFKMVNDAFGHSIGDVVLRVSAERIVAALPKGSVVGRIGGDEFAALVPEVGAHGTTGLDLDELVETLNQPILVKERSLQVRASIGLTVLQRVTETSQAMVEADMAMYRSKVSFTSSVTMFDESLRQETSERAEIEQQLHRAIKAGGVGYVAQPIFRISDAMPVGVELLARLQGCDGQPIPPSVFIPLAEETGHIGDLGRLVLQSAVELLQRWSEIEGLQDLQVNVNIAPKYVEVGLMDDLIEIVPHELRSRLGLEFTESVLVSPSINHLSQLTDLADSGLRLILDDFGTGYSSLAQLRTLPITDLKIDRSFVSGLDSDPVKRQMIRSVTHMCDALGLPTVVEGVETNAELDALRSLRVRVAQGNVLSGALPLESLDDYLLNKIAIAATRGIEDRHGPALERRRRELLGWDLIGPGLDPVPDVSY